MNKRRHRSRAATAAGVASPGASKTIARDVKQRGAARLKWTPCTPVSFAAPEAEAELDDIWLYVARESGRIDIATRVAEDTTDHFWLLARIPTWDASATGTSGSGCVAFRLTTIASFHRFVEDHVALILGVVRGSLVYCLSARQWKARIKNGRKFGSASMPAEMLE